MRRIVVAGASLAGLSAAEALRQEGFDGDLVVIGAEETLPYDRPPLSKQILAGEWDPAQATLRGDDEITKLQADWRLGRRATALDPKARSVSLDDGEQLAYDGLVIATGASPRWLPGTEGLAGVHVLRTLGECLALRGELELGPRVGVVGGGFIGAEVAATARARGLEVTMVEALPALLSRVLPGPVGEAVAAMHRDEGVDVRLGVGVESFDVGQRVERAHLTDGSVVEADVVVVGIGVVPATGWLESSGLPLDNGVVCDATCATPAPGVVAAGDIARWPNPLFGEDMRVEHWSNAVEQGWAAALTLLADEGAAEPFAPVPYFWSDQYQLKIQMVGRARPDDDFAEVEGSLAGRAGVALFGRAGKVVGALAFNRPRLLMKYRRLIASATPWDDALDYDPNR